MINEDFSTLFQQMGQRSPIIVLGAGFSKGIRNAKGNAILCGSDLSELLYEHFYIKGELNNSITPEDLADIRLTKSDLEKMCTNIRAQGQLTERNQFLSDFFRISDLPQDDIHNNLVRFPWEYIFTLNIDNVVEEIYKNTNKELSVWDRSHPCGTQEKAVTRLIKLHGSVNDTEAGFVFDKTEYGDFKAESNSLLSEFASQALQHDLILLGTQFQEDDLQYIISLYHKKGYDDGAYRRFYIAPTLPVNVRLKVRDSKCDYWIPKTTDEFLHELTKYVAEPRDKQARLYERGVTFLDSIDNTQPSTLGLYRGEESRYSDFFNDVDIKYKLINSWKRDISNSGRLSFVALYGVEYCGKSCFAKRLLVELFKDGYNACQIIRISQAICDEIVDYWSSLPTGTRIAIYVDKASYAYNSLVELKNKCPLNIEKLVIITDDNTSNHLAKRYELAKEDNYFEYGIITKMDEFYAKAVFEKLKEKNRLGHFMEILPAHTKPSDPQGQAILLPAIARENDIIDALYFSSEGENFHNYYQRWLSAKTTSAERDLIYCLCCLNKLGISSIPNQLLYLLGAKLIANFQVDGFVRKFSDIISSARGWSTLRRSRILYTLIKASSNSIIFNAIQITAEFSAPKYENIHNEIVTVFERILRVKRIRNNNLVPRNMIIDLFPSLEGACNHLSYFWVQYGIAAQIKQDFSDANNHLLYAKNIHPNAYQVNHALAKNSIEWGLALIEKKDPTGEQKFELGLHQLLCIIEDKNYYSGYQYSVHTFVSSVLKHYELTGIQIAKNQCDLIIGYLDRTIDRMTDSMMFDITRKFISYCEQVECTSLYSCLKRVNRVRVRVRTSAEEYDID